MAVKINKRELNREMMISVGRGKLTKRAQDILVLLAKMAINKYYYYKGEDEQDCMQSAYLVMFQNWHNFNSEKSENAFAYFTEIFKRGATLGLNTLYKKKGDPKGKIKLVYYNSSNDGEGVYNF